MRMEGAKRNSGLRINITISTNSTGYLYKDGAERNRRLKNGTESKERMTSVGERGREQRAEKTSLRYTKPSQTGEG